VTTVAEPPDRHAVAPVAEPGRRRAAGPALREAAATLAMVAPGVVFLALFFVLPLVLIARYSVGLAHLAPTAALAKLAGELTGFSLGLWRSLLAPGATLELPGADIHLPAWAVGVVGVALLAGAVLGGRLGRRGPWIVGASLAGLALPFVTIPAGNNLLRLAQLHSESRYLDLFFKSVSLAMTASILAVLIAFPIAYFLACCIGRSRYTWLLVVIAPFFTSFFLRLLAWKVILGDQGLVNTALFSIGARDSDHPLSFLIYSQFTVIVVLMYAWVPFVVLPIFVALEGMDRRLHEAAADLGASRLHAFRRITLPLAAPGIVAGFLFVFIPSIGEFVTPLLVGGTKGYMFGNAISDLFVASLDWQNGSVLALFLLAVVLLLTGATSRYLRAEARA
jgi:spermidine/putrescine transport system permease protein